MAFYNAIEAGRRLAPPSVTRETGITEYYDPERKGRFLHIPNGSRNIRLHDKFAELGMAVFEVAGERDEGVELSVPAGTMTIRQALPAIARDPSAYTEIFRQLGGAMRVAEDAGVGGLASLPGRALLSSVAYSPDEASNYGGTVHFVPPYAFDPNVDLVDNLLSARKEMLGPGYFGSKGPAVWLLGQIVMGYN